MTITSPASVRGPKRGRPGAPEGVGEARPGGTVVFDDVEVEGRRASVRVEDGWIVDVGAFVDRSALDDVVDGRGGALIGGLHDHHIHLAATAALARSVQVGPPAVQTPVQLRAALVAADAAAEPGAWLRAVGYHHSVAGDLDRTVLDGLVADRPVRVQDATGARWTVNSAGARALGLDAAHLDGIERDGRGVPTGRLHRLDGWLRDQLHARSMADGPLPFAELGRRLASYGITGVTDTTASATIAGFALLGDAVRSGALRQRITVTGGVELLGAETPRGLHVGPVKVIVDDGAYPDLDRLAAQVVAAHRAGRPVAFHAASRVALTLVLAAIELAGPHAGDRVEHGSVIAPEHLEPLRRLGLTVVTQPSFIAERGDRYLAEVDPDDIAHLYRCGSLVAAGIGVAAGSDAPYASADPWQAVAAAVARTSPTGAVLGAGDQVTAARALELFLGTATDPGGPPRRVRPGAPADLCLLHLPLADALASPSSDNVRAALVAGHPTDRPEQQEAVGAAALTGGEPSGGR